MLGAGELIHTLTPPPPTQRWDATQRWVVHHRAILPPAELSQVKEKPDARLTTAVTAWTITKQPCSLCGDLGNQILFERLASPSSSPYFYQTVNDGEGLPTYSGLMTASAHLKCTMSASSPNLR